MGRRSSGPVALFRADASSRIGMGHLFRSMAIAEEMKDRGWDVVFLVRRARAGDPYVPLRSVTRDISYLPNNADLSREMRALSELIRTWGPSVAVLDSYRMDGPYLRKVQHMGCPTVYIDDLAMMKGGYDLLINYNAGFKVSDYKGSRTGRLLVGPRYCPLNKMIRKLRSRMSGPPEQPSEVRGLLVTMGGGDQGRTLLGKVLGGLKGQERLRKVTITSKRSRLPRDDRFQFIGLRKDLPSVIKGHRLGITAGGSTCYQFATLGVPNLVYTIADNQLRIAKGLEDLGISRYLGQAKGFSSRRLSRELSDIATDRGLRERMAKKGFKKVDGKGTARIVDIMERMFV